MIMPDDAVKVGFHYSRLHAAIPAPRFARLAEELGFDSVFLPEGLVNEVEALDILMAMSAFVHHSERLTVGAGVVLLPLRNPAVLAKEIASLDVLSGGRIVLGIGAGGPPDSNPAAFEACGVRLSERGGRTDEALEVMTKLWSGASVSHRGRFYRFADIAMEPRPVQRPHPPLWAGGASEPMLRRAARWCDGFFPVGVSPTEYRELWGRIERYGEECGRDTSRFTKAIHLFYRIDRSEEEARARAEQVVNERRGFDVALKGDGRYALGTPADCVRVIEAFIEAGVTHLVFNPLVVVADMMGQVERLAGEVLPRIR
jgi:probable F420-dependent oxidoreductase